MKFSEKFAFFLVIIFTVAGFYFRLKGISVSHSFWADEAYNASVSRDIYEGRTKIYELPSVLGAKYQSLYILITSGMFFVLGPSEYASRLPSVFAGTIAIILSYYVAKGFSNKTGGLIAAFLTAFGQIQLVYSTQSRPYAMLIAAFLGIIYCLQLLADSKFKKNTLRFHIILMGLCIVSALLHTIGVLFSIIYFIHILIQNKKRIITFASQYKLYTGIGLIGGTLLGYFVLVNLYPLSWFQSGVNNTTYFRELFTRQYFFIFLPAVFGIVLAFRKYPSLISGLTVWMAAFIFAWTFIHYSHSIRYLTPFITVLFIFFGVFWGTIFAQYFKKYEVFVGLCLIVLLYAGGYKIARKPAVYYNPNQDLYGDIQNANHKEVYKQIREKFPTISKIAVFNDIGDAQQWYLPEKPIPDVYLMRTAENTVRDSENNIILTKSLKDFIALKNKYKQGILIVEDWHSFLPEDIKEYAKKNMKREIRVEGLPEAQGDNWPIEVYSWGL